MNTATTTSPRVTRLLRFLFEELSLTPAELRELHVELHARVRKEQPISSRSATSGAEAEQATKRVTKRTLYLPSDRLDDLD